MKAKITAEEFALLTDDFKKLYVLNGDESGEYVLDPVAVVDYAEAQKNMKERALSSKASRDSEIDELRAFKEEQDRIAREKNEGSGNWEELYKTEQARTKSLEDQFEDLKTKQAETTKSRTVESTISTLTNELCGSNNLLMENYLKTRIGAIIGENGGAITVVKSPNGETSGATLEELKAEIRSIPDFQLILKGNGSTGGDSSGAGRGTGGGSDVWKTAFDPTKRNLAEQNKLRLEDPTRWKKEHEKYMKERGAK